MCFIQFQPREKGLFYKPSDTIILPHKIRSIHPAHDFMMVLTSDIRWPMHHHQRVNLWSHSSRRCSKCHLRSWYTVIVITTTRYQWAVSMLLLLLLLLLLVINISCILEVGITFNYWTSWKHIKQNTALQRETTLSFIHTLSYGHLKGCYFSQIMSLQHAYMMCTLIFEILTMLLQKFKYEGSE